MKKLKVLLGAGVLIAACKVGEAIGFIGGMKYAQSEATNPDKEMNIKMPSGKNINISIKSKKNEEES